MGQLKLEIIDAHLKKLCETGVKYFNEQGGSIGRAQKNDWVLNDENRYLSSIHAYIYYQGDQFYIKDVSTNGVFINDAKQALNKSEQHAIAITDQMQLQMGLYKIKAELITSESLFELDSPFVDSPFSNLDSDHSDLVLDGKGTPASLEHSISTLNTLNQHDLADKVFDTLDPLEALNSKHSVPVPDTETSNSGVSLAEQSQLYRGLVDQAFVSAQQSESSVQPLNDYDNHSLPPENWDCDNTSLTENVSYEAKTPKEIAQVTNEISAVDNKLVNTPNNASEVSPTAIALKDRVEKATNTANDKPDTIMAAPLTEPTTAQLNPKSNGQADVNTSKMANVLTQLGFDMSVTNCQQINDQWVEIMPLLLEGIMNLLQMRSSIKGTFNVEKTTISTVENNPLKFSNNAATAIDNLFIHPKIGFTTVHEAFTEVFNDLTNHQQAMTAGFQQALDSFNEQLSPDAITQELADISAKKNFFEKLQQPSKWNFYQKKYNLIMKYSNHSFIHFFGDEFINGYNSFISQSSKRQKK